MSNHLTRNRRLSSGPGVALALAIAIVFCIPGSTIAQEATSDSTIAREATSDTIPNRGGTYQPGTGFVVADTEVGELAISFSSYIRYLNQTGLDDTYSDTFGRTFTLDKRNDIQLNKVMIYFKGWLFDPKFRYLFYVWTSNTSQGDPAQVVVAGNLGYKFADAFNLYAGIGALPGTRSLNYTFPNWLKYDHRGIADEFFRGSYTTGLWANGAILPGLEYRAMIGNNLSQLGVNAAQLNNNFDTYAAALWWMPTTGEYGPGNAFGDFEQHEEVATLFGVHATFSTEDKQAQPGTEGFENSQIRLSDGTRIFSDDPFGVGVDIDEVNYRMIAVNAGAKYEGFSFDAEGYFRHLSDFKATGPLPIDELSDNGFQVQGSAMIVPRKLQAILQYSKIFSDHGDPWDFTAGAFWFPFGRKEMRVNGQALYLHGSPVGYSSVPMAVGGTGWVFSIDVIVVL